MNQALLVICVYRPRLHLNAADTNTMGLGPLYYLLDRACASGDDPSAIRFSDLFNEDPAAVFFRVPQPATE